MSSAAWSRWKRGLLGLGMGMGMGMVGLAACTSTSPPSPPAAPAESAALAAVKSSMRAGSASSFREGPLNGGVAVLAGDAAYWVQGGRVFAANGVAKSWSPGVGYAPAGIDAGTVTAAVR